MMKGKMKDGRYKLTAYLTEQAAEALQKEVERIYSEEQRKATFSEVVSRALIQCQGR